MGVMTPSSKQGEEVISSKYVWRAIILFTTFANLFFSSMLEMRLMSLFADSRYEEIFSYFYIVFRFDQL
jgi:hypothetical protein